MPADHPADQPADHPAEHPADQPSDHPALPEDSRFDHVGYACRELEAEAAGLAQLGYRPIGEPFEDPLQGVHGLFLEAPAEGPYLELLAPLEGSTVLDPWLGSGARMYHLAYEVPELDPALEAFRQAGARVLGEPVPAVAFAGRRICFTMLRGARLLVELIEQPDPSELLSLAFSSFPVE